MVRRLALALAVVALLSGPSAATLWVVTPDVSDIQQRVQALTDAYGVPLLAEDEVPKQLAEAVVATEDERFYSHHGVDSIGLARAVLYDAVNACLCQGGSTITA
ncbi:MAG TPA: transglycosylase domain-containing protein, partial [Candidatus Limnocylindrales bacterium]|nr:transglycosylase domain-containing protein [Candidatus Limnocylindrales bacterium]